MKRILGPKPLILYSHLAALGIFKRIGFKFDVRRFGESRLGLLRWSLRKVPSGKTPRRLVMVPGFGDTPLSWVSLLVGLRPILSRKVDEVIILDYPGYSGFLHEEAAIDSMDELMRCFHEVMNTLKPEILMGHSLGGWLSADYAIGNKSLKELILMNPGGVVGTDAEKESYRGLFKSAVKEGPKGLLPHTFHKKPIWLPIFEEQFFHFLKSPEIESFVASFGERHILNSRIGGIRAKTTIIWGEFDTMTPSVWISQWMKLLPAVTEAHGVLIEKCGHSPQVEKPGVLMALLTQIFLGQEPSRLKLFPFWKIVPAAVQAAGSKS